MIRAREDILGLLPAPALCLRVMVSWTCRAPLESGLPSTDDYDELGEFEGGAFVLARRLERHRG